LTAAIQQVSYLITSSKPLVIIKFFGTTHNWSEYLVHMWRQTEWCYHRYHRKHQWQHRTDTDEQCAKLFSPVLLRTNPLTTQHITTLYQILAGKKY